MRYVFHCSILSVFIILFLSNCKESTKPEEQQNPEWIVYNTENSGLPDGMVTSLAIDKNGNKWIGTHRGLAKFDGVNWTVYNTDNSRLPFNFVFSITIDGHGNKWIGTWLIPNSNEWDGALAVYREGGIIK